MSAKVFFSCCLLPPKLPPKFTYRNLFGQLSQSSDDLIERRAIKLAVAAIEIAHPSVAIDDQRSRARNVNTVGAERVMESVLFGHGSILIEQKRAGDGMLLEKFSRLPHAIPLFRGNERQLCSRRFDLREPRLELSHALHAVRSPGAA